MDALFASRSRRLREIVARAKTLEFYRDRLADVEVDTLDVDDLRTLPTITREELAGGFARDPHGGFLQADTVQMHLTPAPGGRMPEYLTRRDIAWQAQATRALLERCALTAADRCLVVFSYHMLAGGWLLHDGLVELGAAVLPLGPVDAEQVVEIASEYGFNVLVGNPSFAGRIGEAGGRFDTLIAAGEPFSAVPGYRERIERALGCRAYDAYGLSETGIVAAETKERTGLWPVPEACILEVLDPDSLEPVEDGDKGELVVTSLTREAMPILRFRTGDLTLRGSVDGRMVLPRGVFGRTDAMVKVKGVKLYPKELLFLLAGTPGLDFRRYQLEITSRADGTDHIALRVQGDPATDTTEVAALIRRATGISMNALEVLADVEGEVVIDRRFGAAAGG